MRERMLGILLLLAALLPAAALCDALSVEGTVTADDPLEVYAPIGGTVDRVAVKAGQAVEEGETLLTLRTTKIYADADGRVTGVFGEPGDALDTVVERYGAVLYLETESLYTISASTEYAYSATETKTIHVGETVYVRASGNYDRTGRARVTAVAGTKFTAEILEGGFITGEKAYVYRDAAFSRKLKLGYGEVSRTAPIAVTGASLTASETGNNRVIYSIARIAVEDGQSVRRGDLLVELLPGRFDGLYMSGADVASPAAGTVGEVAVSEGVTVAKDAIVARLYTKDATCVTAEIPEENLSDIRPGSRMRISLTTDESHAYVGTVRLVSGVATEGSQPPTFKAWIDFTPDDAVRYGSTVTVETLE